MRSCPVEVGIAPLTALEPARTPFLYRRRVVPSNVVAKWVHASRARAEPVAFCSPSMFTCPTGRPVRSFAYRLYAMPRPFSFTTTVCHFFSSAVGLTDASIVIPVVRSSEAESAIDTKSFTPSNESAKPVFAVVVQAAPEIDPASPCPETSATVLPLPASKE